MSTGTTVVSGRRRARVVSAQRAIYRMSRRWFPWFLGISGLFVSLPWLAPALMWLGWEGAGRFLYAAYSLFCHQLPERSFFLFGPRMMYSLPEIQAAWQDTLNPMILRQFIGTPAMGFKVAWSDRMVSMYTSIPVAALIWWRLRHRLRPLSVWGFVVLALPMAIDGLSHTVSDLAGIGQGFRASNAWLAALTDGRLPPWFYAGDALGSFNSWMRLITGALFGMGLVWTAFPHLDQIFGALRREIEAKFERAGERL